MLHVHCVTTQLTHRSRNLLQTMNREESKCKKCSEVGLADVVFASGQLPIVAVDDWGTGCLRPTKTRLFDLAYSRMKEEQPCCIVNDDVYALYCIICLVSSKEGGMGRYVTYTFDALNQEWACFDASVCKVGYSIPSRFSLPRLLPERLIGLTPSVYAMDRC